MAVTNVYNAIDSALRDRTRPWMAPFVWLEVRTGIGHMKLFVGSMLAALVFAIASGRMVMLVSNLLGFAYPMYATIDLMVQDDIETETPTPPPPPPVATERAGRHAAVTPATRWLTYWITFAAVLIVQQLCGDVLQIIPFYFLAKIVFFAWCALPMEANGAAFVHRFVVRDHLKRFFI